MATSNEASVTITTPDTMATEEHDDDDSDLDEAIRSSYDKTEFRLGIVGVVFIIAGALFLIVPGTLKRKHPEEHPHGSASSSGFFITGGVMFGLGAMMIAINVFWCLNEQKILRDIEKAKEKKAQERFQRTPQCAYHSLPQPSTSSLPVADGIICYGDDTTDLETYVSNKREIATTSDPGDDKPFTSRHNTPDGASVSSSLRPTTFDNPSYLSDTTM